MTDGFNFTEEQIERYARHIILPEIGGKGQSRLLSSHVLIVGMGGLGSPVALYLTAAGVGHIGIVDSDQVDRTNLQRQVIHFTEDLGSGKLDSARRKMAAMNPEILVTPYPLRLNASNALDVLKDYDVIVDGTDNFPTRYLLNDACVFLKKPLVHAGVIRYEGQISVFKPGIGPCYRCIFPEPPPAGVIPSCREAGILGVIPGILGLLQANEVLKLLLGIGQPLIGHLLLVDALHTEFRKVQIRRNSGCAICGERPTITRLEDVVMETCELEEGGICFGNSTFENGVPPTPHG